MARELVQTRADADTVETLEAFAEERDITRSEAIRRLLRTGLAQEGHPVAATDGAGQLANRLDSIEARQAEQEHADRLHTIAILTGFAYIVATLTLGLSGLLSAAAGIGTIIAIAAATYYRNSVGDSDE